VATSLGGNLDLDDERRRLGEPAQPRRGTARQAMNNLAERERLELPSEVDSTPTAGVSIVPNEPVR